MCDMMEKPSELDSNMRSTPNIIPPNHKLIMYIETMGTCGSKVNNIATFHTLSKSSQEICDAATSSATHIHRVPLECSTKC